MTEDLGVTEVLEGTFVILSPKGEGSSPLVPLGVTEPPLSPKGSGIPHVAES